MSSSPPESPTSKPVILFSTGSITYEFVRYLGSSSNGEVLLARRQYSDVLGSTVIIKRLRDPSDGLQSARLMQECRLIIQFQHPGIAQAFLVLVHDGSPHLVMEYFEGSSLEALLNLSAMRGIPVSEEFAAYVVSEVADALFHAHTLRDAEGRPLGIVHRDISPRSIRVGLRGQVKLTEFAVAYSKMDGRLATVGPMLRGDIAYSSPEYLLLQPLDARSDLFSLGVVLLELVTGKHLLDLPEVEESVRLAGLPSNAQASLESEEPSWVPASEMAMRMERFHMEHVERVTQGLSAPMRAILTRALQKEPADRYQSGLEMRDALWDFLRSCGSCYGAREAARDLSLLREEAALRGGGAEIPEEDSLRLSPETSPRKPRR